MKKKRLSRRQQRAMFARINVPSYARRNARMALKRRKTLPRSEKFGTRVGVGSAKIISEKGSLSQGRARRVESFLSRNAGQLREYGGTPRILGARGLWGGDKTGRFERYLEGRLE